MWNFAGLALVTTVCFSDIGAWAQTSETSCGAAEPCVLDSGYYHAALPEDAQNAPVVLWLHGFGGRAERAARPKGLARNFTKAGFVFVAPQGAPNPDRPTRRDWNVADGDEQPRNDVAFLSAVLDDVAARFGTNPDRILLAGFSRGASMAWDFACAAPERIAGVAVAAGGFWEPMTPHCAGPVHLFHSHGFGDQTVPLEGRKARFGGVDYHQGNILKGLEVWREVNGCTGAASTNSTKGAHWEKRWETCAAGSIRLQITPIGHGIPKGWSLDVLQWFEKAAPAQG